VAGVLGGLAAQGIDWSALNDANARRQLVLQLLRVVPILWIWTTSSGFAAFPEWAESQWTAAEQSELRTSFSR